MADLEAQAAGGQRGALPIIATDGVFLDGRHHRQPARHLRSGGKIRRAGDGGRRARGRVSSAKPDAARTNIAACRAGSTFITGTLGKALGGASGGYTSGRKEIVDLLRQRSRPYLFLQHGRTADRCRVAESARTAQRSTELRDKLEENTKYFRAALTERGLTIKPGIHPIVPIMLGDAAMSQKFAARMLEKGVYVIGFFYPVVPHGTARVRTQVSAAHSREELEFAVNAFAEVNEELK